MSSEIEIDAVPHARTEFDGIALGNLYDLVMHRALHEDIYYEITFLIHSGSIGAYPPGIVEFDRERVLGHLQSVLATFQFVEG